MIDKIAYGLSGEFFLKPRPNGGGVVLARSICVTFLLYIVALAAKSSTDLCATLSFSFVELQHDVNDTIPWAGAIFAGVYAAFYARYSSQWSYLASTYNQLMAAKSSMSQEVASGNQPLISWQAGFVSDAYTLHLDRKPIYMGVIAHLLADENIKAEILNNFDGVDLEEFKRRHVTNQVRSTDGLRQRDDGASPTPAG